MEDQATFDPTKGSGGWGSEGGGGPRSAFARSWFSLEDLLTFDPELIEDHRSTFACSWFSMEEDLVILDPDLVHDIFKLIWNKRAQERERNEGIEILDNEAGTGVSKKNRPTTANANALKLSCELLRLFIAEAVQRAATISDAECVNKIEATHLERILPQLLLDF